MQEKPKDEPSDIAAEKAIEALRGISEAIQQASDYDEVLKSTEKAEEANAQLSGTSKELKNRADTFNLAIQEKVHSFLRKEVTVLKKQLAEPPDEKKINDLRGRLKKYESLANSAGFHKRHIQEQITYLFEKLGL